MQVNSIAECILQYFRPSLSYHLSLSILSGRFTQDLLNIVNWLDSTNVEKLNTDYVLLQTKKVTVIYDFLLYYDCFVL